MKVAFILHPIIQSSCYRGLKERMELVARPNQDVLIERFNGDEAALRRFIVDVINEHGSIYVAAQHLKVSHTTLNYWRKKLNITYKRTAE